MTCYVMSMDMCNKIIVRFFFWFRVKSGKRILKSFNEIAISHLLGFLKKKKVDRFVWKHQKIVSSYNFS